MTKKFPIVAALLVLAPSLASAQIHQVSSESDARSTVNFTIGYFALKGLDSRVCDDVLLGDLQNADPLLFEIKDFNGAPVGGEYLFGHRFQRRGGRRSGILPAYGQRACMRT